MSELSDVGVYGLTKIGQNLALNLASKEFKVCIGNSESANVDETLERAKDEGELVFTSSTTIQDFVSKLSTPRKVILSIEGSIDDVIAQMGECMSEGDVIVDCSNPNEWYENAIKRSETLKCKGIYFMDMDVSGDTKNGPSLLPGGDKEAFDLMEPILSRCAGYVDEEPCTTYVGPSGSGYYIKMVQNSIEQADMQLIAEAYDILKRIVQMSNKDMAEKFSSWNEGDLSSYLMEITSKIIAQPDDITGEGYLIDFIQDKGTASAVSSAVKEAVDNHVSAPSLSSALEVSYLSASKEERVKASSALHGPRDISYCPREQLIEDLQYALYSSKICIYTQGLNLIQSTSAKKSWDINLSELIRTWKSSGCILRAKLLDKIQNAVSPNNEISNILLDKTFSEELKRKQFAWRRIVTLCVAYGVACPTFCASLNYYDSYRCERLPSNLILAQMNYMDDSCMYERTDREGLFNGVWNNGSVGDGSDKENEDITEEMSKLSAK